MHNSQRKIEEFLTKQNYLLDTRAWFKYNLLFLRFVFYNFNIKNKKELSVLKQRFISKKGKFESFVNFFESRLSNVLLRTTFHKVD